MNTSFFIARRLYMGQRKSDNRLSRLATLIAVIGVAIGLAVMILSVCVLLGFKGELTSKIIGFGSHIQVVNARAGSMLEEYPIEADTSVVGQLAAVSNVKHLQRFSNKMGVVKTESDFKGIVLKGVGEDFNSDFLSQHLVQGNVPVFTQDSCLNDVVISKITADQLHLKLGDRFYSYFFEENVRTRKFRIVGIYQTHLEQFDESIVLANIYTVNRLTGFTPQQAAGLEIFLNDANLLNTTYSALSDKIRFMKDSQGNPYEAYTAYEIYAQIFNWLKLLDLNVWVILILMICTSCFTIISGLLIIILEKTTVIGILKALGSSNRLIRKIFIQYTSFILLGGILWGDIVGIGFAYLQQKYHLISLDASKYYMDHVPILLDGSIILLVNISTILICLLAMVGPSYIISRIRPIKAIRFD